MNYYIFILLAIFLINFYTFTYIIALKRNSPVNRAYLIFSAFFGLWTIIKAATWSIPDHPSVLLILRIVSFNWIFISFVFVNFTYIFINRKKSYTYYSLLSATSVAYLVTLSTNYVITGYTKYHWGLFEIWGPLFPAVAIIYTTNFVYSGILIYNKKNKIKDPYTKKQLSLLLQGTGVFLFFSLIADGILTSLIGNHPAISSSTGSIIQSIFVFRAVTKYNFLSIGVEEVSHDLFTHIKDSIILADPRASIIQLNESAREFLKVDTMPHDIKVSSLFANYNFEQSYKNYETRLSKHNSQTIVSLSQATVKQHNADIGKLIIVRDITEAKKAEEALLNSTIELEKLTSELERKVAERTKSLQDSNVQLRQQISERERAEAERAEEQERLAVTLRSIGDGVITTDTQGNIVLLNQVAEEIVGWRYDQAVRQPLQQICQLLDEHTQAPLESAAQEALRNNAIVNRTKPTLLVARDGTERIIAESGAPIRVQDGVVLGAVLVFRDITEQRKIEEELVKADRLESIGVLASGIAHDFNNILTAIMGNVSLAKMYAGEDEKAVKRLTNAENAALRARDLTQQLLTFSKGGKPIKRVSSIKALVQESVDFSLRGSNVKCELALASDLWAGNIDVGQISQVVHNLIINADQAMPNGGILSVWADNTTVEIGHPAARLTLKAGPYIKITIADQGSGITEDQLQKIFDPYFTTKQTGSGLGLFTAYSIIKKHEGHIAVDSTVDVGTTFFIYLPASPQAFTPAADAQAYPVEGTGRILVMEDEETVMEVVGSTLRHFGYEVAFAHDGAEALATYQTALQLGKPFDAILLDLTIPGGMGGKETIAKLLAIDPAVKAIVASGYANDPILANFHQYGFCGQIAKPYQADTLHQVLHGVLLG